MEYKIQKNKQGFTLLELLLVIAIIAVLAGIITFALRPAENIQNAEDVRAMSNAADIKKALELYALDHEGQYPTALQAEFDSGLTRVDICVSGETCEGVDLTTPLVIEGYLSTIPIHSTYGSTTDSGYDIYSSGGSIGVIESPRFLLRDDFTTAESAPLTSPRTAEPGPGSLDIVDPNNAISISSGYLEVNGGNWITNRVVSEAVDRTPGILLSTYVSTVDPHLENSFPFIFTPNPNEYTPNTYGFRRNRNISVGSAKFPDLVTPWSIGGQRLNLILRSQGFFSLTGNKLEYVGNIGSETPVYFESYNYYQNMRYHDLRVFHLPSPFDTDYGLATERIEDNILLGTSFNHEPDFIMEYYIDTLPSQVIDVHFRIQDSSNFWRIRVYGTKVLELNEFENGTRLQKGSASSAVNAGSRIELIAEGSKILVYSDDVLRITQSSALNLQEQTDAKIGNLGGGAISNLITWPRTLSGEAAEVLNKALL